MTLYRTSGGGRVIFEVDINEITPKDDALKRAFDEEHER